MRGKDLESLTLVTVTEPSSASLVPRLSLHVAHLVGASELTVSTSLVWLD